MSAISCANIFSKWIILWMFEVGEYWKEKKKDRRNRIIYNYDMCVLAGRGLPSETQMDDKE